MDHSSGSVSGRLPLGRLVADALVQLEQLGYDRRSLRRYRATWRHLAEFSHEQGLGDEFSDDLAARFVEAYDIGDGQVDEPGKAWRRHVRFGIKVLRDFAHYGYIERPRTDMKKAHVVVAMKKVLREYEAYCKDRLLLRPSTLRYRVREVTIFLDFLRQRGIRSLDELQAVDLSAFVSSRGHLKAKTVSRLIGDIRSFLRYLTMRGITHKDLSRELPKIRIPKDAHIPSVWDRENIAKLLRAVDRSSAKGKRDYAILLLACRLGLRAGDVRMLQLDHINWEGSRIELRQSKTHTPLSLPLTEEVGRALIDYLKSGRPKTTHRHVFLKLQPPFEPFTESNSLHYIVTYWRQLAGITFPSRQRCGLHSLRHSLATGLLQEGTSFETISEILGHATLESTRIYAKADVEALRGVALDPEEVSHAQ
jgi:site-specific recombinase XerD